METVREARARYFAENGFSEAAYDDAWVRVRLGPVPFAFPNSAARRRAIPLHDLHHVATGYATSVVGEAEIGAWELGGGCRDYWAAWALNVSAFAVGLLVAPARVYRAFLRGRRARPLYHAGWRPELLDLPIDALRTELGLPTGPVRARPGDRRAFAAWTAAVVVPGIAIAAWLVSLW